MASNYNTNSDESLKSSPPLLFDETDMQDIDNRRRQRRVTRGKPTVPQEQITGKIFNYSNFQLFHLNYIF